MSENNVKNIGISMFPVAPPFDVAYRNEKAPYPVGPHSHNAAELYFTLTDLPDVLINDTVSAVPAGTLLILPSFCIHQLYHETGVTYERYILTIHTKWLNGVLCEGASAFSYLENSSAPVLLSPNGAQKKELLRHFNELLSFSDRTTPEAMIQFFQFLSVIRDMVNEVAPNGQPQLPVSPSQKRVNEIIAYLSEHLSENLSISDLASHFYLHPDYLARLFKSHMHVSIGHYVSLQKISAAEALLREGQTVAQVQEALGYSSYAYFFKSFQKITGISPSKYRDQYR
ncbi:MAG: helix-turn-helix transcriptional regulator [Lachnospiraceae bacterium]|nr:helix-turn-helix transcriptional regulator [Lachnospiraceae bacterium]